MNLYEENGFDIENLLKVMADESILLAQLRSLNNELVEVLKALLEDHVRLVNSGDCGFWDVELEPEVIAARAVISKAENK